MTLGKYFTFPSCNILNYHVGLIRPISEKGASVKLDNVWNVTDIVPQQALYLFLWVLPLLIFNIFCRFPVEWSKTKVLKLLIHFYLNKQYYFCLQHSYWPSSGFVVVHKCFENSHKSCELSFHICVCAQTSTNTWIKFW